MRIPLLMLLAGLVGNVATLPGQTNGVSPFTDFLLEALPLARSQLSLAYLAGTILSALLMPAVGRMYDRRGSRITGTMAAFLLGASLFAVSFADVVAERLASLLPGVAPALSATLVMSGGFFLLRFFGQGTLSLTSRTMVMKWYDHRRGMANAIFAPLSALAFAAAPLFFDSLIVAFGWRGAWRVIGAALMFGVALFAWLVFKDPSPEEREAIRSAGAQRDKQATDDVRQAGDRRGTTSRRPTGYASSRSLGFLISRIVRLVSSSVEPIACFLRRRKPLRSRLSAPEPSRPEQDYTLAEAKRTYSFWLFNAVIGFSSLVSTGFTFHVVGIFASAGMERTEALGIFLPATLVAIAAQAIGSAVSDSVRLRSFAAIHMAGVLLIGLSSLALGPGLSYWVLVLGVGLNAAMMGINCAIVWPRFYGLSHLGSISGASFVWMVAGSAFGPYAYSLSEGMSGSYDAAVALFAAVAAVLLALSWFARNPNVSRRGAE